MRDSSKPPRTSEVSPGGQATRRARATIERATQTAHSTFEVYSPLKFGYVIIQPTRRTHGHSNLLSDKRRDILRIAAQYGAGQVRVFGSLARGEAGPDSDVDILVTLEPGRSLLDLIALKQDLEDLLGCKVDVVTEAAVSPYIRAQVLRDAIAL